MVYVLFGIMALITIFVAVKLSRYADIISKKTALGGMLIGSILLALATSLPELTTSATAIIINNPDLAVGNLLGSNLFNMLIIAAFDMYFRRQRMFRIRTVQLRYYAVLSMILTGIVLSALLVRGRFEVYGVGLETFIMFGVYGIGMWWISRRGAQNKDHFATPSSASVVHSTADVETEPGINPPISVKQAVLRFAISAVVILIAGAVLTVTGDRIAVETGLGASFVGSFLIAASTSLPEAVSVYVAVLLGNYRLAVGSALSSNLFNLIFLAGTDVFFRRGSLLMHVAEAHQITAFSGILLTGLIFYALQRKQELARWLYLVPSMIVVVLYFIFTYIIFIAS